MPTQDGTDLPVIVRSSGKLLSAQEDVPDRLEWFADLELALGHVKEQLAIDPTWFVFDISRADTGEVVLEHKAYRARMRMRGCDPI